jgi:hypothetical protein
VHLWGCQGRFRRRSRWAGDRGASAPQPRWQALPATRCRRRPWPRWAGDGSGGSGATRGAPPARPSAGAPGDGRKVGGLTAAAGRGCQCARHPPVTPPRWPWPGPHLCVATLLNLFNPGAGFKSGSLHKMQNMQNRQKYAKQYDAKDVKECIICKMLCRICQKM